MSETSPPDSEFLTQKQVCAKLNVNYDIITKARKSGALKFHKFGGAIRYRLSDVDDYIASVSSEAAA